MDLRKIFQQTGLQISNAKRVSGGDINEAFCLYSGDRKYFLKINEAARYPEMFETEANGLNALKAGSSLKIPEVIKHGIAGSHQYLVLEWLEKGSPGTDFWQNFGRALAEMHKVKQPFFGFHENNYIGSLPQKNTKQDSWAGFYADCRIMPLAKQLKDEGSFSLKDVMAGENFCKKINEIFPEEDPSLLHGDLWSGNYMIVENGIASIYDPAVYYGHREMDLGMTLLFGGFSQSFYDFYNEAYPLEKNWRQRVPYTQLYPLLVHAILFRGHYVGSVREILRAF